MRRRDRSRSGGAAACDRDHVHRLPHARARPARQPGREGALHVGRPAVGADGPAHPGRGRQPQRRPALPEPGGVAGARAGPEGRDAQLRGRRRGAARERDRRPGPGGVRREQCAVLPPRARGTARRAGPDRPRPDAAHGHRPDDHRHLADGRRGDPRRRPARGDRDRGRGDRSADAGAARHRHAGGVGAPHRAGGGGARGGCGRGVRGELAARLADVAFDCLQAPIQRVGAPFAPVPVSPPLEDAYRPGADQILAAARRAIEWDWPESESLELPVVGAS